jgi:threonine-phosphate decarboxylase
MDIHDYAENRKLSHKQVMDFTTCVNPLGPSSKAKNMLRKNIKNLDLFADKKLRHLARFIVRNEKIHEDNIVFGQGSTDLLYAIFQAVKTKKVLIPSPVSQKFEEVISYSKVVLKRLPLEEKNHFSMNLEKILRAMKKVDTVIMPYPHDMAGTALAMDDLHVLIGEADKLGKTLILDESYRDFTALGSPVKEVIKSEKTIIVRTFSLFYALAGLPIGYAIGPAKTIENIQNCLFPGEMNALAMYAAIASLKDNLYKTRTTRFIDEEKGYFLKAFASIENLLYFDTPCPFFVLKIEKESKRLKDIFYRYRILIYDFFDEQGGYYLKVPIKKHKWNARFLKTLRNALEVNKP